MTNLGRNLFEWRVSANQHHLLMLTLLLHRSIYYYIQQLFIVHRHLFIHAGIFKTGERSLSVRYNGLQLVGNVLLFIGQLPPTKNQPLPQGETVHCATW